MRKSSRRSDQRMPPRATLPGAQVHAFDARRVHEDLEHRAGERKVGDLRRVELQHDARHGRRRRRLEPVRAQRREHEVQQRAQDAVFVEARRPRRARRGSRRRARRASSPSLVLDRDHGSRRATNSSTSRRAMSGCAASVVCDVGLAEQRAGLAEVPAVRAQQRDLAPRRGRRASTSRLNPSSSASAVDDREERFLERGRSARGVDRRAAGARRRNHLIHRGVATGGRDRVRMLVVDDHAHVREARQHVRERRLRAEAVELEVEVVGVARRAGPRAGASARRARRARARSATRVGRVEVVLVRRAGTRRPTPRSRSRPASSPRAATSASRRSSVHARAAAATRCFERADVDASRRRPGRRAARSAAGRAPTPTSACSTRSSSRRTRRRAVARCARARASCSDRAGGTRGTTRTGRTARGARTAAPAGVPAAQDRRSRCRRAGRRRSGTGRRAGTSRGSATRSFWSWLAGRNPARSMTSATLRRSTGTSIGLAGVRATTCRARGTGARRSRCRRRRSASRRRSRGTSGGARWSARSPW